MAERLNRPPPLTLTLFRKGRGDCRKNKTRTFSSTPSPACASMQGRSPLPRLAARRTGATARPSAGSQPRPPGALLARSPAGRLVPQRGGRNPQRSGPAQTPSKAATGRGRKGRRLEALPDLPLRLHRRRGAGAAGPRAAAGGAVTAGRRGNPPAVSPSPHPEASAKPPNSSSQPRISTAPPARCGASGVTRQRARRRLARKKSRAAPEGAALAVRSQT